MYELDRVCFEEKFQFSRRAMRGFAEAANAVTAVAERDGTTVGFAIGEADGDLLYLVTLDVALEVRRVGLARRLLERLETMSPKARNTELHVFTENPGAIAFYEREGFIPLGRERDFYGKGMDAVRYRRKIPLRG